MISILVVGTEISFESVEQCQVLQDLLMKRLSKESPDVKVKTLRVIKQLLLKGHRSFRIELQRRTDDLQPCLGNSFLLDFEF